MAITEKVRIVVDVVASGAKRELDSIKGTVQEAEGSFGKIKSVGSGVLNSLKENWAAYGTAAATAIVAFGTKAVNQFQDLALSANKFADATGTTTEEASRLIEVMGDIGVETSSVQSAINKMNKEIATNRSEWEQLGVVGGSTQETFVNVIGYLNGIKDPAERARQGTKLLGKSWTDMAEVVEGGADTLNKSLASVSDAKVIDAEEAANARKFRDALDELNGIVEDFTLMVGGELVPLLTQWTNGLMGIKELIGSMPELPEPPGGWLDWTTALPGIGTLTGPLNMAGDAMKYFGGETKDVEVISSKTDDALGDVSKTAEELAEEEKDAAKAMAEANKKADEQARAAEDAAKQLEQQEKALRGLIKAQLAATDSTLGAADAFDSVLEAMEDATKATDDSETAVNEQEAAHRKAIQTVLGYAAAEDKAAQDTAEANQQQYGAKESAQVQIAALEKVKQKFPELSPVIDDMIGKLREVSKPVSTTVSIYANISDWNVAIAKVKADMAAVGRTMRDTILGAGPMMAGGPVDKSGFYDVGEAGKERVFLPGGAYVANAARTEAMDRAATQPRGNNNTYNIKVEVAAGVQPADVGKQLVSAITAYERANGNGWRQH